MLDARPLGKLDVTEDIPPPLGRLLLKLLTLYNNPTILSLLRNFAKFSQKRRRICGLTGFVDVEQLSRLSMAVVFLFWKFSIMVATSPLISSELPQFIEFMGLSL